MRYELGIPTTCPTGDFRVLVELAVLAEEAGWNAIFLEDYITHWHAKDAPTCDPWVLLTAIAQHTTRVRLGISITPLSRRRPWKVAREAVTLDHLSNGRLVLGVGLGDVREPGFTQVGEVTDPHARAHMLDEALDIIVGLWSGESFSYSGDCYQIQELTFKPVPVQQPRIPIWVGASLPHKGPVRRAARWDGILAYKYTSDGSWQDLTSEEVRALKAEIEGQRTPSAPFEISLGGRRRGPDWEQERRLMRELAEAGGTAWMEYLEPDMLVDIQACMRHVKQGPLRIDGDC